MAADADGDAAQLGGPFDEPMTELTNAHLVVTDAGKMCLTLLSTVPWFVILWLPHADSCHAVHFL